MAAGAFFFASTTAADLDAHFAAMNQPLAPFKIADNLYYVGANDVTAYLIVTGGGHLILLDGGFEQTAPQILANIRTLGFDPKKVRILLNSHAHFDHAGGLAALKAATGALFLASDADAPVLAAGGANDFALKGALFPPIKADHTFPDGTHVSLGGVTLTAHVTAGHTKGCTTWTMPVTIDGRPEHALFLCSLSVLPVYLLIGDPNYPGQAADYEKSFATLKAPEVRRVPRLAWLIFRAAGQARQAAGRRQAQSVHRPAGLPRLLRGGRSRLRQAAGGLQGRSGLRQEGGPAVTVQPFLMFEGKCEEAMSFYVSLIPGSKAVDIVRFGPGEPGAEGSVRHASFVIGGLTIQCVDSPVKHAFTFTPASSLFIDCDTEAEVDRLAAALSDGGQFLMPVGNYGFSRMFAWLNDRFGVSWQLNLA